MHTSETTATRRFKFALQQSKVVVRGSFLPIIQLFAAAGFVGCAMISFSGLGDIYLNQLAHSGLLVSSVLLLSTIQHKNKKHLENTLKNKK